MQVRKLTQKIITTNEERIQQAIKILRKEGNPVYRLLVEPRVFLFQLAYRALLVKNEDNTQYVGNEDLELTLAPAEPIKNINMGDERIGSIIDVPKMKKEYLKSLIWSLEVFLSACPYDRAKRPAYVRLYNITKIKLQKMDRELLKASINHILESGANEIRIMELFDRFVADKEELIGAQQATNRLQALQITALENELKVTDKLLAERQKVIDLIPECQVHGGNCIPHALEWIQKQLQCPSCQPRERFQILKFHKSYQYGNNKSITVSMFVPGVNSGAYSKELGIQIIIRRPGGLFSKGDQNIFADITLNRDEVELLKIECEKILSLEDHQIIR